MLANGAIGGDQPGGSGREAVKEAAAAVEEEAFASAGGGSRACGILLWGPGLSHLPKHVCV